MKRTFSMNINRLGPPSRGTVAGYAEMGQALSLSVAEPLYALEKRGLVRRRARAKGRGEDVSELEARIALVDSRLKFYDDVLAGFCAGYVAVAPVRDGTPEYDYVAPPAPVHVVGVPKFEGTINEVGVLLGEVGAKVVDVEGKKGAAFAVVKQAPVAGAELPGDGKYGLNLTVPAEWANNKVVLMSQLYRLAPAWLAVDPYAEVSDKVAAAIVKVVAESEIARLKTDGDKMIEGWAPTILKAAKVEVEVSVLKAALKFAVALLK